jgi:N-acetylneuraminic acid mutarotase
VSKHTFTLVGSKVYLFGGICAAGPPSSPKSNNLVRSDDTASNKENNGPDPHEFIYVFDTETISWSRCQTHGAIPTPRASHTANAIGDKIYVFGGGLGSKFYSDLYVLDLKTFLWSQPTIGGPAPSARRAHSSCVLGSRLYILGGGDASHKALSDVWVLDTSASKLAWAQITATGGPSARGFQTATAWGDSRIVVFGGSDTQDCFCDCFTLDPEKRIWSRAKVVFSFPRYGHSLTAAGPWLFLFGGHTGVAPASSLHILNLQSLEWTKRPVVGVPPAARLHHTAFYHDSRLWLFGGSDTTRNFNDLHVLDLAAFSYLPSKRLPKLAA